MCTNGIYWCNRCGAYTRSRARNLVAACPGRPSGAIAKLRRQKLRAGRHPVSGARLREGARRAVVNDLSA
eukprot:11123632-Karenia_brevis.AAC.1